MPKPPVPIPAASSPIRRLADGTLEVLAPAKVNLDLYVGPVDKTGYHPLDSIVSKIIFYDRLVLTPTGSGACTFRAGGLECGPEEENLALRAATALHEAAGVSAGVDIQLEKTIPHGMGLGGGSSDAGAVLMGLNMLWGLDWPLDALVEIALELGSDVPLFLAGPASRMRGRGELLEPISISPFGLVLILPQLHCSTGAVYHAYDDSPAGEIEIRLSSAVRPGMDAPAIWRDQLRNDLAAPARRVEPALAALWDELASCVDVPVHLTGSGSGLFIVCDALAETMEIWRHLPESARAMSIVTGPNPW